MTDRPLSIDILRPLVMKANELALLTQETGDIARGPPGFGLFYRDTCYLSAHNLRLHGGAPVVLMASDADGVGAEMELTNPKLSTADGREIDEHQLCVHRRYCLVGEPPAVVETIEIRNFADQSVTLPLSLDFTTAFEDVMVLRGSPRKCRGRLRTPHWDGSTLLFAYEGADRRLRELHVSFSLPATVAPRATERTVAHFDLGLAAHGREELIVVCRVEERPIDAAPSPSPAAPGSAAAAQGAKAASAKALVSGYAQVETAGSAAGAAIARSIADLAMLEIQRDGRRFISAGIPWFVGLFGRDSLLPSLQCLAFNPDLSAHTARSLAHWQGRRDDPRTREEPGKILHELRVGELAHLREIQQTPSYAAVDSTLLFLIAVARHVGWVGDPTLFHELRPAVEAALAWLERKLAEGEGYVAYEGVSESGQPINQSWRDSGRGVLCHDGSYPEPPLALVEVQGYAFQSLVMTADVLARSGESPRADALRARAEDLRLRFQRDYWMEAEGCYCLALEKGGRQVATVASNAAQALWTGIASPEQAKRVAERVLRPDMFSGWGVRTLSTNHAAFDPLAYQQGSVWPFDNSLIVSGLRRYGEDAAALRVAEATFDAASHFQRGRLPEFIAGTQRGPGESPVRTPRADPVQAWSAAALPFLLSTLLGLEADGFGKRLIVRRPLLPAGVDDLTLKDLRAAGGSASLRFERRGGAVQCEVLSQEGLSVVAS